MTESTSNKKEKILHAAWKLFLERGYEDTTLDDILKESHTSRSGFYHLFHSKEELLFNMAVFFDANYSDWFHHCLFQPKLTDIFLKLLDENRVVIEGNCEEDGDDSNLPHIEIEKFISDVMIAIKAQEDSESYDFLTGLPMRNRGEKLVAQFMQEFNGCLIFMEVDNLKKINDIYGHKAGDRALRTLGHLLSEIAEGSVLCCLGGDEFLLFLPDVSKEAVSETVKQLLEKFQSIKSKDPELQYASISAGLCMTEESQIPKVVHRIFLQYHKLYNKSNSINFIPKYEYIAITKNNGTADSKTKQIHLCQSRHNKRVTVQ